MAAWVKCTDYQDRTIFVNLDVAISLVPITRTAMTKITFIGADKDSLEVKETAEHLVESVRVASPIDPRARSDPFRRTARLTEALSTPT
jgi:hypothetical protein